MTGIATVAVGFVPTYDSIGIWGAVLLTVIRLIQGIGVGGEWGGSVLLAMEWARTNKNRGFLSAWPQFGAPAGLFLANCAVLFFSWFSGDQFLVWGWRIPFFLSIVMVGVGLWIRLGIMETPVFQKMLDEERIERVPVLEVLEASAEADHPDRAAAHAGAGAGLYRRRLHLHLRHDGAGLLARFRADRPSSCQTVLGFLWVVFAGHLSDRRPQEHVHTSAACSWASSGSSTSPCSIP